MERQTLVLLLLAFATLAALLYSLHRISILEAAHRRRTHALPWRYATPAEIERYSDGDRRSVVRERSYIDADGRLVVHGKKR